MATQFSTFVKVNLDARVEARLIRLATGHLTLLLGTGGVKFNLAGHLLVSGAVSVPLTNAGLRSRVTTVIGLDYAF